MWNGRDEQRDKGLANEKGLPAPGAPAEDALGLSQTTGEACRANGLQPEPAAALGLSPHTAADVAAEARRRRRANGLLPSGPMECALGLSHKVAGAPGWAANGLAASEVGLPKAPLGLSQDRELSSGRLRVGVPPSASKKSPPLVERLINGEAEPDPCRLSLPLKMT